MIFTPPFPQVPIEWEPVQEEELFWEIDRDVLEPYPTIRYEVVCGIDTN